MADSSADAETSDTGMPPDGVPQTGMPRWVKLALIIGLVLVLLLVVGRLTGVGGEHGPGRHGGGSGASSTVVTVDAGHRPPVDHRP